MAVKRKERPLSRLRAVLLVVLFLALVIFATGAGFLVGTIRSLPVFDPTWAPPQTSMLYDKDGNVFATLHAEENRIPVSIDDMPKYLPEAFVATEDERFFRHWGFDLRGMARAIYVNLTGKGFHGASTITQQLVRKAFLKREDVTIKRKLQEIFLAIQVERRYTKKEILEMYLNQIPLGHGAYGVQAASQVYFGKDVGQLTLGEAAMLAGLAKSPYGYSPFQNMEVALNRRAVVLNQMVRNKYIDADQAEEAKKEPLNLAQLKKYAEYPAPYFVDHVLAQLLDKYGDEVVYGAGLKVYTTLDKGIQEAAEKALKKTLDPVYPLDKGKVQPEAAVVVIDPKTGHIVAMIGGRSHGEQLKFNRATQAKRQPGSAFKPIVVYTPAVDMGYTPSTVVDDSPVTYNIVGQPPWTPQNYDKKFRGLITIRQALESSVNVVAVKVLDKIGIRTGYDYAVRMGISTLVPKGPRNDYTLPLALGGVTDGVTPLEMAKAYAVLANQGIKVEPIAITRVVDRNGNILEENTPRQEVVLSRETAYLVTDMLKGVIERGTGTPANIGRPAAGKTGTTSDDVDAWFVGYTPDYVGVVWMGYDKPRDMGKVYGSTYPAPIWRQFMTEAHKKVPVHDFERPSTIVDVAAVCTKSGKLPGPWCPAETVRSDIFLKGTEPTEQCDVHVPATVCTESGQLATAWCPPGSTVTRSFIRRPEPYVPFTDDKGQTYIPLDADQELPTEQCTMHGPGGGLGVRTFNLSIANGQINPASIVVRKGDVIRLVIYNQEDAHTLVIPDFGVNRALPAGERVTIQFAVQVPGTYSFYCDLHGQSDWRGQIIVQE